MKRFTVTRQLPTTPERAWAVLTDAQRLVGASLGLTKLEGVIAPGAKLRLWTEATGDRAFALTVKTFEPGKLMTWEGGMPFGLFRGVRTFRLTTEGQGTRFEMTEEFSGLFAGMIVQSIPDLTPSFERFARGLEALTQETP